MIHKVLKSYTLPLDVVETLEDFIGNRPELSRSRIVEESLRLWFDKENEKAKEEFFKENPDGF